MCSANLSELVLNVNVKWTAIHNSISNLIIIKTFIFLIPGIILKFQRKKIVQLLFYINMLFSPWVFPAFNLLGFLSLKPTDSGLKFVPWSAVISVSLTSMLAGVLYHTTVNDPFYHSAETLKNIINLIKILNVYLATMLIIIYNIVVSRNGSFASILTHINEVESVFVSKGFNPTYGRGKSNTLMFVFFGAFLLGLMPMSIMSYPQNIVEPKKVIYICHIYIIAMEVLFIRLAELLSNNFVRLNKLIRPGHIQDYRTVKIMPLVLDSETPKITIEEIGQVHYKLCQALDGINSFFGVQLICLFSYIFVLAVINPFFIVDGLTKSKSRTFDTLYVLKQMTWSLFAVTLLVAITWISTYTTYHAKRSGFHVSCLLNLDLLPETRNKVKSTMKKISNNTCEFNVLNLFKINTTNITSFAGMAVTYFIVILQFYKH